MLAIISGERTRRPGEHKGERCRGCCDVSSGSQADREVVIYESIQSERIPIRTVIRWSVHYRANYRASDGIVEMQIIKHSKLRLWFPTGADHLLSWGNQTFFRTFSKFFVRFLRSMHLIYEEVRARCRKILIRFIKTVLTRYTDMCSHSLKTLLLLRRSRRRHFSKPCNPWIGFRVKAIWRAGSVL